ncbi:MAG: preprotein translocase subunit YajC [Microbacterium sp.]|uniref:preprotein translocase subunit YajC n=1 Tax=Microbacterium sp. TaxID=51671 RepID=UPI0039E2B552
MGEFFGQYGLLLVLGVLLVFMFVSSRRRTQRMKAEQEQKARQTVPGAEVLMQGGLYGTIVSYDPDNLDQPAVVEIAPGVEIKVHSQAILRIVSPTDEPEEEAVPMDDAMPLDDAPLIETAEETAARLQVDDVPKDKKED